MSENSSNTRPSFRFRLGIALLIASFPVGYGGLAAAAGIAAWRKDPRWLLAGAGCYAVSWVMFLAAIALSGRDGVKYVKSLWTRWRGREPVRTPDT